MPRAPTRTWPSGHPGPRGRVAAHRGRGSRSKRDMDRCAELWATRSARRRSDGSHDETVGSAPAIVNAPDSGHQPGREITGTSAGTTSKSASSSDSELRRRGRGPQEARLGAGPARRARGGGPGAGGGGAGRRRGARAPAGRSRPGGRRAGGGGHLRAPDGVSGRGVAAGGPAIRKAAALIGPPPSARTGLFGWSPGWRGRSGHRVGRHRREQASTPAGSARTLPGSPCRGHRSFHLVESQLAASRELRAGPRNDPQELRMLAQRQRLSINVPKRDDCRDCTIPLREHEDLVPQVGGILGERTPSRCQVDALHSRTSSPPIGPQRLAVSGLHKRLIRQLALDGIEDDRPVAGRQCSKMRLNRLRELHSGRGLSGPTFPSGHYPPVGGRLPAVRSKAGQAASGGGSRLLALSAVGQCVELGTGGSRSGPSKGGLERARGCDRRCHGRDT